MEALMLNWRAAALLLSMLSRPMIGEVRFGMQVEKLASPKEFRLANLDGNRFAVLERESSSVSCIMYGGPQRHFVEVKIANRSSSPIVLDRRFVTIDPGESVVPAEALAVAAEVRDRANIPPSRPIKPPPNVEPILAAMEASARIAGQAFASHLATFAQENQSMTLEPGQARLYVFVFDQLDRKNTGGFAVVVRVGSDTFLFPYGR